MADGHYRFERFTLDSAERRLWQDGLPVELNARYLDALLLLLQEPGTLVSKERFFEEVWRGIPVTDEALTQCIRTLRRQLGDSATAPRFIETVPKYGYRFIAPVRRGDAVVEEGRVQRSRLDEADYSWQQCLLLGAAGTTGGGVAGLLGGLCFGFIAAAQSLQSGVGALSVLLVLVSVATLVALVGAFGVAFGIALMGFAPLRPGLRQALGGALGGLCVGGFVKLLGLDALQLLFGQAPRDITGAFEGLILGGAVGWGLWLSSRKAQGVALRHGMLVAALTGGCAGLVIPLLGGSLLNGSLSALVASFPDTRLRFDLSGDGPLSAFARVLIGGCEGALFSACVVGALMLARRYQASAGVLR
jgi:DNA-binding winged helix-turn-helix (wHTH) protein